VGSAFFELKKIANTDKDAVCLLIGKTETNEEGHKAGQLVEHYILIVFQSFPHLFFFRLQHTL
jgi:hypothetical protein